MQAAGGGGPVRSLAPAQSFSLAKSRPRRTLFAKLLLAALGPTLVALGGFGFFAHEVARRLLEEELGRRLGAAAAGAALLVLPEADSRASGRATNALLTYDRLRRSLEQARQQLDVRRVALVAADLSGRGDTDGPHRAGRPGPRVLGRRGRDGPGRRWPGPRPRRCSSGTTGGPTSGPTPGWARRATWRASWWSRPAPTIWLRWPASGAGSWPPGALGLALIVALTALLARQLTAAPGAPGGGRRAHRPRRSRRPPCPSRRETRWGCWRRGWTTCARRLRARDERLQMMLAGIAHEVRNPLGGLELYAGLLRESLAGEPERLAEVARIEREIGYLENVVTDFLEYARRPRPELRPVPLRPLLDEVAEVGRGWGGAAAGVECDGRLPSWWRWAIADSSGGRCSTWCATPCTPRAPRGQVVLAAPRGGDAEIECEVRDSGAGRARWSCGRRSSSPSSPPGRRAPGWAWPSCGRSCATTAARSRWTRAPEGGARFRFRLPRGLSRRMLAARDGPHPDHRRQRDHARRHGRHRAPHGPRGVTGRGRRRGAGAACAGRGADFVITDLKMEGVGGLEVVKAVQGDRPRLPGADRDRLRHGRDRGRGHAPGRHGLPAEAVRARGAAPEGRAGAGAARRAARAARGPRPRPRRCAPTPPRRTASGRSSGETPPMRAAVPDHREGGAHRHPRCYIHGESGTGKELVARAIHDRSKRAQGPFVKVNCGALAETLLESELFGHEKGAFTGRHQAQAGPLRAGRQGHAVPRRDRRHDPRAAAQAAARAAGAGVRAGGRRGDHHRSTCGCSPPPTATSKAEVAAGRFREDLFYRLHVVPCEVPPLRERREDIPLLVRALHRQAWRPAPTRRCRGIDDAALARLCDPPLAGQRARAGERHRAGPGVRRGRRSIDVGALPAFLREGLPGEHPGAAFRRQIAAGDPRGPGAPAHPARLRQGRRGEDRDRPPAGHQDQRALLQAREVRHRRHRRPRRAAARRPPRRAPKAEGCPPGGRRAHDRADAAVRRRADAGTRPGPGPPGGSRRGCEALLADFDGQPHAGRRARGSPVSATRAELEAVHAPDYVARLAAAGGQGAPGSIPTPCVSPGSWEAALLARGRGGGRGGGGVVEAGGATPSSGRGPPATTPSRRRPWASACSTTWPSRPRRRGGWAPSGC